MSLSNLLQSTRGTNTYYLSKELNIPGLSLLPDALQQKQGGGVIRITGRSPGEMQTLMNKAAGTVGRSLVREPAPTMGGGGAGGGAGAAAAAGGGGDGERRSSYGGGGSSGGDSDGWPGLYPAGGVKAAAANATAVAARRWQPPPLVTNLEPPRKGSPVLVSVGGWSACLCVAVI